MNNKIEFKGYISGKSEQHFRFKSRFIGIQIILISIFVVCPGILIWGFKTQNQILVNITFYAMIAFVLGILIPKTKKEWRSITPKRIFIDEDCIVCVADKYTETKHIKDVKKVKAYDEFYELVFPIGKVSEKFICQKNLLSNGTLEELEALFDGKIIRMKKNQ